MSDHLQHLSEQIHALEYRVKSLSAVNKLQHEIIMHNNKRDAVIYTASKAKHAAIWRKLRADGVPINSTWIDEAGAGETSDFNDLWTRCLTESTSCAAMIVYREPGDELKGAWIEMGAALSHAIPVFCVGLEGYTISKSDLLIHCHSLEQAINLASQIVEAFSDQSKAVVAQTATTAPAGT